MVKRLSKHPTLRSPRGNVAHYWLRAGLTAAASWLDHRAAGLRRTAAAMTSEYDDPSLVIAQAKALEGAATSILEMADRTAKRRDKKQ